MTSAGTRILLALTGFGSLAGTIIFVATSASTGHGVEIGNLIWAAFPIVWWTVGAVIVVRAHRHPVGLLLTLAGVFGAVVVSGLGFITDAALLATPVAPWVLLFVGAAFGPWSVTMIIASMVLFPDGRLPGRGWRLPVLGPILMVAVVTVASVLLPGAVYPGPPDNPAGLDWLPAGLLGSMYFLEPLGIALLGLVGAASLLSRFRRGTSNVRAQLKWLLASVVPAVVLTPISFLQAGQSTTLAGVLSALALLLVPIAIGIAILRYRLYDIDRIISRTLAYTALTATLAIVYVAAFVGLQATLTPITSTGGSLAVAASTLVVLALFQPLRRRLQSAMDRRFNRSTYDAPRIVEAFAARLRDEVDLGMVRAEVLATVDATVQPNRATVWLREPVG